MSLKKRAGNEWEETGHMCRTVDMSVHDGMRWKGHRRLDWHGGDGWII